MTSRFLAPLVVLCLLAPAAVHLAAQAGPAPLPELTQPVNDTAGVIDAESAAKIDRLSRDLQAATGDVIVVATRKQVAPFMDIRELAVKWFENNGRGIGNKDTDAGVLIVMAVDDRQVWIEVGYGLEGAITDGFAGNTSRTVMSPLFREGRYGEGLYAGVVEVARRVAAERQVSLDNLPRAEPRRSTGGGVPVWMIVVGIFILMSIINSSGGGGRSNMRRGRRRWGGPWSGWGGFGGGMGSGGFGGGGFGGGGFGGGGFGGFGGGGSGGGGGGSSW